MEFFVFLIFALVLMGIFKGGRHVSRQQRRVEDFMDEVMDEAFEGLDRHRRRRRDVPPPPPPPPPPPRREREEKAPLDFECDHCGAQQKGPMDLSPSGDVKCTYCGNWFNVRT